MLVCHSGADHDISCTPLLTIVWTLPMHHGLCPLFSDGRLLGNTNHLQAVCKDGNDEMLPVHGPHDALGLMVEPGLYPREVPCRRSTA
jgi:hypothetical protein